MVTSNPWPGEPATSFAPEPAEAYRPVPWLPADILRGSLAALGLLIAGLFLVVIAAVVAGFAGLDLADPSFTQFVVFVVMGLEAVFILPAWLWGPRKYGLGLKWLGFRSVSLPKSAILTVVGLALVLGVNLLWGMVMERFDVPGQPDLVPLFGEGPFGIVVAIAVACVVAPFAEEIFFRGFMFAGMRDRWGLAAGVLVSSLIFALFHMSLSTLVPIALMGAVFALLYERAGSLWPCIALHAIVNLIGVLGAYAAA